MPDSSQLSGITLLVSPAWMVVTEITAESVGFILRVRMVWKACTISQAIGTGSMPGLRQRRMAALARPR